MSRLLRRLHRWMRGGQADADLAAELEFHRALAQERLEAQGLTREEALAASRRALGNVTLAREDARRVWIWPFLEHVVQDARHGLRALRKQPLFTAAAVTTLGLAIGAVATMLSVVDAELWRPLPWPDSERVVAIKSTSASSPRDSGPVSAADFLDWRAATTAVEDLSAYQSPHRRILRGRSVADSVTVIPVTPGFFTTLRTKPMAGSDFTLEDAGTAAGMEVLLTDAGRRRLFPEHADVIGETVTLDDVTHVVKGVLAPDFRLEFLNPPDMFVRIPLGPDAARDRNARVLIVVGRLRPQSTLAEATASLQAIAQQLERAFPDTNKGRGISMASLREHATDTRPRALYLFLGAVALLLVLGCTNVTNLILARAFHRRHEFAVRAALGGGPRALIRQLAVEGLLLVLPAAALAILLTNWAIGGIGALVPPDYFYRGGHFTIGTRVLVTIAVTSTLAVLCFAVVPGAFVARIRPRDDLTHGARTIAGSASERRASQIFVIVQVAIALVLLFGAGLFLNSFIRLTQVPVGFEPANRLTARILLSGDAYRDPKQVVTTTTDLLTRLRALPGVTSAAMASSVPLRSGYLARFLVGGQPLQPEPSAILRIVSSDYFETLGIRLTAGRAFTDRDAGGAPRVVIINETLARRIFPGKDPLGQTLDLLPVRALPRVEAGPAEIVGIAADTKNVDVHEVDFSVIHVPLRQHPVPGHTVVVAAAVPAPAVTESVRAAVRAVDPGVPFYAVTTMDQMVDGSLRGARFNLMLTGVLAILAVLLTAAGVYAVMSYAVQQRTREFGVRLALGARPQSILSLALGRTVAVGGIGAAIGLSVSLLIAWMIGDALYLERGARSGVIYGVSVFDPLTLTLASAGILTLALAAGFVPARRATRVDPVLALRSE